MFIKSNKWYDNQNEWLRLLYMFIGLFGTQYGIYQLHLFGDGEKHIFENDGMS